VAETLVRVAGELVRVAETLLRVAVELLRLAEVAVRVALAVAWLVDTLVREPLVVDWVFVLDIVSLGSRIVDPLGLPVLPSGDLEYP